MRNFFLIVLRIACSVICEITNVCESLFSEITGGPLRHVLFELSLMTKITRHGRELSHQYTEYTAVKDEIAMNIN